MIRRSALILACLLTSTAADWPQWRGPNRDGISTEKGLLKVWPLSGPRLLWKSPDIGDGYSTPVIVEGRVYLQSNRQGSEYTQALDATTGKQIWSKPIGKVGKNLGPQYPGTRSTPTVDGDVLYSLASDGELSCLERGDGKLRWKKSLRTDLDGKMGMWAYSESVLIDGDALICTPGGKTSTLAALNKKNGDVIWKTAVPEGDDAHYASVMILEGGGAKQYVQFLQKGVVGVDAKTGKLLWRYNKTIDPGANIATPIVAGNQVFSSGSRGGGGLVKVSASGGGVTAEQIYYSKQLGNSIGGMVLVDGHLYGTNSTTLLCVEFATGKVKWAERSAAPGAVCFADGHIYLRSEKGPVVLVEANSNKYVEKGRFNQPDRSKIQAWPHPVIANGCLYLRDQGVLLCYDVHAPVAGS